MTPDSEQDTTVSTPNEARKQFLIEQLKVVAKQSLSYKKLIDGAKTSTKKEYYQKKLKKHNKLAVGILVLLEKEGVQLNKDVLDVKQSEEPQ